jgi:hypothetical protein
VAQLRVVAGRAAAEAAVVAVRLLIHCDVKLEEIL